MKISILPRSIKDLLRQMIAANNFWLRKICSRNIVLTKLYYALGTHFDQEQQSTLAGAIAYKKQQGISVSSSGLLRRNIHRIEKGLIMRPRRNVFAESFIFQTVATFEICMKLPNYCESELKWSYDVLNEYFSVCKTTPKIERALNLFRSLKKPDIDPGVIFGDVPNVSYTPYEFSKGHKAEVSIDQLGNLFKKRRSVRWYKQAPIDQQLLIEASDMASFAPSACNRQPYKFLFFNNPNLATKIAECAGGTSGFADNIPCICAVVGDLSYYEYERDRHLIYIDASLAAMQLMLALEVQGLSSCSINWPEVADNEKRIRKLIPLSSFQRVIMLIAVGFAEESGAIPFSSKKFGPDIVEVVE